MWMKTVNEVKRAIVDGFEQEIDLVESLKQYLNIKPAVEAQPLKAIEKTVIEDDDIDDDFMAMLEGL